MKIIKVKAYIRKVKNKTIKVKSHYRTAKGVKKGYEMLKHIYPESRALSIDRNTTAKKLFKRKDQWLKYGIDKSDLVGYDTKRQKELSVKEILKKIKQKRRGGKNSSKNKKIKKN